MASETATLADAGFALGSSRTAVQRWFAGLILGATVLPFLLVPVVTGTMLITEHGIALLFAALLFTGAHQQSSWYLYADSDSRRIAFAHRLFFFAGPIAIAAMCVGVLVYAPPSTHSYFWLAWAVLSIHHYQSQNLGIFGLLTPVLGGGPMQGVERKLLRAGGFCGMLVFGYPLGRTVLEGTVFLPLESWLRVASAAGMLGLAGAIGFLALRLPAKAPMRTLVLLVLVTYYWPLLLIDQPLAAFAMFAGAHGLQYFVIMSFVAANTDRARELSRTRPWLGGLRAAFQVVLFAGVTWFVVTELRSFGSIRETLDPEMGADAYSRIAGALVLSTTLIHYWIDARMWRMSKTDSRRFVRRKLAFLF